MGGFLLCYVLLKIVNPNNESLSIISNNGEKFYSLEISNSFKSFVIFYGLFSTTLLIFPLLSLQ